LNSRTNRTQMESMKFKEKRVLVTGGAGFIGSHLVDRLVEQGAFVRVLDNFSTGKRENLRAHSGKRSFELLEGSILDQKVLQQAVEGIQVIFHLACLGVRHSIKHPEENHRVNAGGTLNLLAVAREEPRVEYFAHVSSSEVYGSSLRELMDEEHPTFPHTVYGASKLAGEAYARAYHITYGLPVVIIRPFNVFGPRAHFEGDAGELIPKSVLRALTGHPILVFGDGSQERDYTYVTDTVEAILEITGSGLFTGETVNIGTGKTVTVEEIARKIVSLTPETNAGIEYTEPRPGDVQRLVCDARRLREVLGFKPRVSLDEGLARVIQWFRENGKLLEEWFAQESGINWKEKI